MRSDSVCCPYCSAPVPPDAGVEGDRLRCPRCGETIPGQWTGPASANGPSPLAAYEADSSAPTRSGSNRKLAGIILGIMFGMAVVGLIFALSTWKLREGR